MSVRRRSLVLVSARRHQLIERLVSAVPSVLPTVLPTELLDSSDFVTFDFVSFGGLAVGESSDSILLLSNASASFFFRQNTICRFQSDLGPYERQYRIKTAPVPPPYSSNIKAPMNRSTPNLVLFAEKCSNP